jgi:hypothetical protein
MTTYDIVGLVAKMKKFVECLEHPELVLKMVSRENATGIVKSYGGFVVLFCICWW